MPRPQAPLPLPAAFALALGSACFLAPARANAVGSERPEAIGKGIVGGALILSELTLTIEAAVGVKPWWGYALGGGLGAIGGGIGGYFIADAAGPEIPTALLVSGLVLAVPTTIFVLSQTSYRPPEPENDLGVALPDSRFRMAPVARVPSLLEGDGAGGFAFGIPAVNLNFTPATAFAGQGQAFEVPVLDIQFR